MHENSLKELREKHEKEIEEIKSAHGTQVESLTVSGKAEADEIIINLRKQLKVHRVIANLLGRYGSTQR
jgi:hypothetical protein